MLFIPLSGGLFQVGHCILCEKDLFISKLVFMNTAYRLLLVTSIIFFSQNSSLFSQRAEIIDFYLRSFETSRKMDSKFQMKRLLRMGRLERLELGGRNPSYTIRKRLTLANTVFKSSGNLFSFHGCLAPKTWFTPSIASNSALSLKDLSSSAS